MPQWFPSNVARNSLATASNIESWSLELQRLWPISKSDRIKLCATFGEVVTAATFGPLYRLRAPLSGHAPSQACPSTPPGMRQRRGPEGSRLCCVCVVVVVAPPAPGPRASSWGNCSIRGATRRRHADRMLLMVQTPRLVAPSATQGCRVTKNAQFFHQPLTVSMACVPRSDSAEWALTRPEDRRAAWKREATFSQFTRFHQALT